MKILFTAPRFHTNQVPIVKGLIEKGHEVRYFVAFEGAIEDHRFCQPDVLKPSREMSRQWKKMSRKKSESEVESIVGGRFVPDFALLKEKIKGWQPDFVICRGKMNLTLCVNSICSELHIPCILYDQEPVFVRKSTAERQPNPACSTGLIIRFQTKIKRMLSADQRMLRKLRETTGYPDVRFSPVKYRLSDQSYDLIQSSRSYYIPLVYEAPDEAESRIYFSQGIINLLMVGKYREYKSIPVLISALEKVKQYDNWHLTIIGQASNRDEIEYKKAVWNQIVRAGIEKRITLRDSCPYEEMRKVYESNDLLILPSKRETYGMAIVEAMAHGLAVICSDTCGAAFCNAEAGGLIVKQGDADALKQAIVSLLDKKEVIRRNGLNSMMYIKNNLSCDVFYSRLSKLLESEFNISMK